jgi:hypothetical protein
VNIPLLLQVPPFLLLGMVGTARVGRLPGRLIKEAGMILKIVLLLLLLASPCFAQQQMAMNVAVIGSGAAAAAGTWYYPDAERTINAADDSSTYIIGSPVTIGTGTAITKLAFRVRGVGTATACKLALYDNAEPASQLATATCTPATNTWCQGTVSYTGSASATYIAVAMCDTSDLTQYSNSVGATGHFEAATYANFPASYTSITAWDNKTYTFTWAVAVCAGGTCSGDPTP